jgi:hypothetical protein
MLHACSYTIFLVFCYTLWRFYAFSGTNLLTRCHSVSSLFSAVFVFQKSYTGNILRIGRNKSWTSRYLPKLLEVWRGDRGGPLSSHITRGRGLLLARTALWWGPPGPPLAPPLRLWRRLDEKNLNTRLIFQKHTAIRRRHRPEIGRVQKLFPAPCRRGESLPEVFFIAILTSGAMSELSTLDYGSIAVARWLSSPPCASCLDLELPYMIEIIFV